MARFKVFVRKNGKLVPLATPITVTRRTTDRRLAMMLRARLRTKRIQPRAKMRFKFVPIRPKRKR